MLQIKRLAAKKLPVTCGTLAEEFAGEKPNLSALTENLSPLS